MDEFEKQLSQAPWGVFDFLKDTRHTTPQLLAHGLSFDMNPDLLEMLATHFGLNIPESDYAATATFMSRPEAAHIYSARTNRE
jgi:hypothetical protein